MVTENRNSDPESKLAPQLRVLDGIAGWCGGLHGAMPLPEALGTLARGLGAECAALSRHLLNEDRPRTVAIHDRCQGDPYVPTLGRAFAQDVMGYFYDQARASTVWFLSDHLDDPNWSETETLANWRLSRDHGEIAVFALSGNQRQKDYIEFHFADALKRGEKLELEALVPTIVRSWSGRKPGLVTQSRMDGRLISARDRVEQTRQKWNSPILGMANPAGLSRAEFRVCLLLSRGLSVKGVTDELGLSEATVRTHLRALYSKTETSSLAELLYRVLSSEAETTEITRTAINQ